MTSKTSRYYYILQGCYDDATEWEDLVVYYNERDARTDLRNISGYRAGEGRRYRVVRHRELSN